jgi:DNA-binding transcriptional ArsR family regulator
MSATSLDRAFHALADPTRRAIVVRLIRGPRAVSDLAAPLGLSLPAIAHHLRALERGGLVRSAKSGRVRICRIDPAAMRNVERWMAARRADWERRLDRLGHFLAGRDGEAPPERSR